MRENEQEIQQTAVDPIDMDLIYSTRNLSTTAGLER
jgi:hypothetical protein